MQKFVTNYLQFIVIGLTIISILALAGTRKNAKILSDNGLKANESTNSKKE